MGGTIVKWATAAGNWSTPWTPEHERRGGNPLQAAIKLVRHEQAAQKHSEENRSACLHWQKPWCTSSHAACLNIWFLWLAWCRMWCPTCVTSFVCVLHVPAQKWEKPHLSHIYFSAWISCSEENLTRLLIHVYLGYLKCNHNESDCLTQPVWLCCSFVVQLTPVPLTSPSSCWVYLRGVTSCHFLSHVICLVSWSALVCFFLTLLCLFFPFSPVSSCFPSFVPFVNQFF